MDCNECQQLVSAYIDDELDSRGIIDFLTHISACDTCARRYRRALEIQKAIRSYAAVFTAPAALRLRLER